MTRILAACLFLFTASGALASQCIQLAQGPEKPRIWNAATGGLGPGEVRISYVGHSAFRIETDQGRVAVTDYYGDAGPGPTPDAVTMNHAHSSHWTPFPDPDIAHPLKGWGDGVNPAEHWLELDDLLIRNVPTDIRGWDGGSEKFGNSIFIFEYDGLCIGHLGHLHHEPTDAHYAMIGRLDIVMAPVDGGMTLNIEAMLRVLKRLRSRLVLPMHAFSSYSMARFLDEMSKEYEVKYDGGGEIVVSAATLPSVPTILLMAPGAAPSFGVD